MRNTILVLLLTIFLPTLIYPVSAQQPAKMAKIGFLTSGSGAGSSSNWRESFVREFGKLGYVEGKNVAFEFRGADTKYDRLPGLANDLVRLKVDVIVTPGANDTRAAKNATIRFRLFLQEGDPTLLRLAWLTVLRGLEATSPGLPRLRLRWPASDWSY